jgi:hypothetical protein
MAYFNRKEIVRILAEKPDMLSDFPESVLSVQQLADMANIPDLAVCDITMMADTQALDSMMLSKRPDAVLPAAVYCGVERLRWGNLDSTVAAVKKTLERTWHVHVLPPVVLGAPLFRSALCLYAGMQAAQQKRSELQCAACFFYRATAFIPLCKLCNISRLYLVGLAPCCERVADIDQTSGLLKYARILLSGYGIALDMAMPSMDAVQCVDADCDGGDSPEFECFADASGSSHHARTSVPKELMQRYFENFAIPYSANVMSRLLAGHAVDFIAAARSLLPVEPKK